MIELSILSYFSVILFIYQVVIALTSSRYLTDKYCSLIIFSKPRRSYFELFSQIVSSNRFIISLNLLISSLCSIMLTSNFCISGFTFEYSYFNSWYCAKLLKFFHIFAVSSTEALSSSQSLCRYTSWFVARQSLSRFCSFILVSRSALRILVILSLMFSYKSTVFRSYYEISNLRAIKSDNVLNCFSEYLTESSFFKYMVPISFTSS